MVSIHGPLGYGPSTLPLRHSALYTSRWLVDEYRRIEMWCNHGANRRSAIVLFLYSYFRGLFFFFSFLNQIDYKSHSSGSLAERSKALVLGTSLSGGVGSNPTAVNFCLTKYYILFSFIHRHIEIVPTHSPDISGGTVARDELPCSESSRVSMITSIFCGKRSILDCILVPAIQFYLCPTLAWLMLPSIFCSPTVACMWWPVSSVG